MYNKTQVISTSYRRDTKTYCATVALGTFYLGEWIDKRTLRDEPLRWELMAIPTYYATTAHRSQHYHEHVLSKYHFKLTMDLSSNHYARVTVESEEALISDTFLMRYSDVNVNYVEVMCCDIVEEVVSYALFDKGFFYRLFHGKKLVTMSQQLGRVFIHDMFQVKATLTLHELEPVVTRILPRPYFRHKKFKLKW
jgi:hypothetical protein